MNANASKGRLQVEVLTLYGEPLQGFTRDDCLSITTDSIEHEVEWQSGKRLGVVGQPVRLRFFMRGARLYSFQIMG